MRILQFEPGCPPELAATETTGGNDRFFWLDVERSESDWQEKALPWLRVRLHDRHVQDTLNDTHPPYYDGMDDYDLLVVRAPETRPVAFILTGTAVVSVHPPGDPLFAKLHQRFLASKRKSPTSPAMLFYLLLDQVTNALLAHRESTSELLTQWQERLLDPDHKFDDWQPLMGLRGGLRRLEAIIEAQMDAVDEWREQTSSPLDASLAVRYNDLQEHLRRVYHHAVVVQQDIDALVQIYFSASAQRTNEILRFLTILSAVFLPLNLLAGLFGMNFTHLPLLAAWYGPWILIGVMLLLVSGLLLWFRRLRWL
jgi:Mg2+ and Co2+ transporter CorA